MKLSTTLAALFLIALLYGACEKPTDKPELKQSEQSGPPLPPPHGDTTDLKRAVWLDSTNIQNYKGIDIVYSGTPGEADFVLHSVIAKK